MGSAKPKILVVDDAPEQINAVKRVLKKFNVEIIHASNGHDASLLAHKHEFALIILDVKMPKMNGYQLAALLTKIERTQHVPILFVTAAYQDDEHLLKAYQHGAIDYLEKPFHNKVLQSKVKIFLDVWGRKKELERAIDELEIKKAQLEREVALKEEANKTITHLATHDPLTNLPNRMMLMEKMQQSVSRTTRDKTKFTVLFFDLDEFKAVNDSYGHDAGDWVLQEVSTRLQKNIRVGDTASRLGGDEFVILLPDSKNREEAVNLAQRIGKSIAEPIIYQDREISISASVGLAMFPEDGLTAELLIKKSDSAMYQVKNDNKKVKT
jgi:diguanylate cyclase (GGDEF)-like protein